MQKRTKVKIAAGTAAAVAVTGGGAAVAASQVWSPKAENQAVIQDAAKQLGVSPEELTSALKKALENQVDAAVAAGRLTKEQGDALKQRIEAGTAPFAFGGLGFARPGHYGLFGGDKLDAAASYLGLSEEQLQSQLENGKTLAEVAKAQGKSVDGLVQAMLKDADAKIDAAVADGKLTKSQADDLKSGLEQRVTDLVSGKLPTGERFRRAFGPGPMFGPPRVQHGWQRFGFGGPQGDLTEPSGPTA